LQILTLRNNVLISGLSPTSADSHTAKLISGYGFYLTAAGMDSEIIRTKTVKTEFQVTPQSLTGSSGWRIFERDRKFNWLQIMEGKLRRL